MSTSERAGCTGLRLIVGMAVLLLANGCTGSSPRFTSSSPAPSARGSSPGGPHQLEGIASYYADEFHGRTTANGERYDMHAMTAAHRTLPFNTLVRVTNLENNKVVEVRVNDRGPFKDNRVIDLSLEAAKRLALIARGTGPVRLEILTFGE